MATIFPLLMVAMLVPGCAEQAPMEPTSPAVPRVVQSRPVDAIVESARADAAKRSGLPASQFSVVSAEAVTWSDGSLGCPQPGMMYTQALILGYRVRLRLGSEVWDYHASQRGGLILCPAGQSREPLPGGLS